MANTDNNTQQNTTTSFNPNDHLMQLKSKNGSQDYLPVQWRLVWFRHDHPEGEITTELVHLDLDKETEEEAYVWNNEKRRSEKIVKMGKGIAIFKATIKDGKGGIATGTKSEKAASFPDWLEKAETGAIGRALAALGYGTQFAPELNEQHRIVDSPIERPNGPVEGNNNQLPVPPTVLPNASTGNAVAHPDTSNDTNMAITEQQVSSIRKLSEYLGKQEPNELTSMSNAKAKETIQALTAQYRESKKAS